MCFSHQALVENCVGLYVPLLEFNQGGMLGGRARIAYDEQHRDRCLVDLAEAIGGWHRLPKAFEIELMPEDFAKEVRPLLLRDAGLRCRYHVLARDGTAEGPEFPTTILKRLGRLAIARAPCRATLLSWSRSGAVQSAAVEFRLATRGIPNHLLGESDMNLTAAQDQKYQEGDSWEWSVWMEVLGVSSGRSVAQNSCVCR
jgi:hypothetical protein